MGNFIYKLFWKENVEKIQTPPPVFLLEDLKPNKSSWSFYKKEKKKEFEYDVPDILF